MTDLNFHNSLIAEEWIEYHYGLCLKTMQKDEYEKGLDKNPVELGRIILTPGEETTMDGYFNIKPCIYVGLDMLRGIYMVFYLGEDAGMHYYQKIARIAYDRIFCHYAKDGGRDYNFREGFWDWDKPKKDKFRKRKQNKQKA